MLSSTCKKLLHLDGIAVVGATYTSGVLATSLPGISFQTFILKYIPHYVDVICCLQMS